MGCEQCTSGPKERCSTVTRRGDSFTAWVAARRDPLLRSTYLLTGDLGRAEDLLQEALVKVLLGAGAS